MKGVPWGDRYRPAPEGIGLLYGFAPEDDGSEEASLIECLRANTGGESWEWEDPSINLVSGFLIIRQSHRVHHEIQGVLERLRRQR